MAGSQPPRLPFANQLLAALPPREYKRLAPYFAPVSLAAKQVLYHPPDPDAQLYFPENAVIPIVSRMRDGRTIEAGMVGNDGVVGLHALFGAASIPYQYIFLTGGTAHRIPAEVLKAEFQRGGALPDGLLRYTQARLSQFAQISACHRFHPTNKRVCRWLLMVHDRSLSDELSLTQGDIARVLGVRHTGVAEAVGILQKANLIDYHSGRLTIRNRRRLERAACECYGIIKDGFKHLLK